MPPCVAFLLQAFFFIDKYTQVPRILNPLVRKKRIPGGPSRHALCSAHAALPPTAPLSPPLLPRRIRWLQVLVLGELPALCKDPEVASYVESAFGGVEACRKAILLDFFRHAFDGSGADNFFDAGSCIDGRLTSAWNWCAKIEKKPYYPIFKLAGHVGFDGKY